MFTGLIQDLGTLQACRPGEMSRLSIASGFPSEQLRLGESIACDGICLSVVSIGDGGHFEVEASPETARRTTLPGWAPGRRLNLERALALGDRLGGHLVQGHVDGVCRLLARRREGGSLVLRFELPEAFSAFCIEKGSVALDGTSLTISRLGSGFFEVTLIPDTQRRTTLAERQVGEQANLETDVLGKYVARLLERSASPRPSDAGALDEALLKRAGFW